MSRNSQQRGKRRAIINAAFIPTVFAVIWTLGNLFVRDLSVATSLVTALAVWVVGFLIGLYLVGVVGRSSNGGSSR